MTLRSHVTKSHVWQKIINDTQRYPVYKGNNQITKVLRCKIPLTTFLKENIQFQRNFLFKQAKTTIIYTHKVFHVVVSQKLLYYKQEQTRSDTILNLFSQFSQIGNFAILILVSLFSYLAVSYFGKLKRTETEQANF